MLAPLCAGAADTPTYGLAVGSMAGGYKELAQELAQAVSVPQDRKACRKAGNCHPFPLQFQLVPSSTAAAALSKVRAGLAPFVLMPAPLATLALQGGDRLIPAVPTLQAVAAVAHRGLLILVPPAHDGIGVASLAGTKLGVVAPGPDLLRCAQLVLSGLGMDMARTTTVPLATVGDGLRRLQRGQLGALVILGHQDDFIAASESSGVAALTLGKSEVRRLLTSASWAREQTLTVAGQRVRSVGYHDLLLTRSDVPPDTVRAVLERLSLGARQASLLDVSALDDNGPIPHHLAVMTQETKDAAPH